MHRSRLNIWLFKLGERTPLDSGSPKLSRTALIAEELVARGHQVLWWMSTFDHLAKRQRSNADVFVDVRPSYALRMIATPGYARNVSLARYWDHYIFDRRLRRCITNEQRPDLILAAYPTIGACTVLSEYAVAYDIPFVVDVRDMWPDVFQDYLPAYAKGAYPFLFGSQIRKARRIFSAARGVIGITGDFVEWALSYVPRAAHWHDRDFPLAYSLGAVAPNLLSEGRAYWDSLGVCRADFVICFFGVLSKKIDLQTVASGMRKLSAEFPRLKLVLCGNGDELESTREAFRGLENVVCPGWIEGPKISALLEIASAGLAPYRNREDFLISVPTKIVEYFAGGLPVITSLDGTSRRLIDSRRCGLFYRTPDEFRDCVRRLIERPQDAKEMGENAQRLFLEKFDSKLVYGELCDHLEKIVNSERRVRPSPEHTLDWLFAAPHVKKRINRNI